MIVSTSGEKLFRIIKNEVLSTIRVGHHSWNAFDSLMEVTVGDTNFVKYIKGATSIYILKKLLSYCKFKKEESGSNTVTPKVISSYIGESVFPGMDVDLRYRIARLVIDANLNSKKNIPKSIRAQYNNKTSTCYLCGRTLNKPKADDLTDGYFTLEHLWPTSLGGDSIDENLLPACNPCQVVKIDYISWEWFNVQNSVLEVIPPDDQIKRVTYKEKVSRHYFEAIILAEENNLSLKDAFLRLGPVPKELRYVSTMEPITFFDLKLE